MTATNLSSAATSNPVTRLLPLMVLAIPVAVSLGFFWIRDVRLLGHLRTYIISNRPTVAFLVHIIASILGIFQVAALTLVINYRARIVLTRRSVKSDTMDLLNALSVPRIAWSLPAAKIALAACVVALAQGPGALWSAALTPAVTQMSDSSHVVSVPTFSTGSAHVWDAEFVQITNGDVHNHVENYKFFTGQAGTVGNCPVPFYQAALLESLREATSWTEIPRNHSKPDHPQWTYTGRSYGMGSASIYAFPIDYNLLGYSYNAAGYEASTSCQYNPDSNLTYIPGGTAPNLDLWYVSGTLPISIREEYYPIISGARTTRDEAEILAWAGVAPEDQYMIGITSSPIYGNFTNIQCSVTFTPRVFTVSVNLTSLFINVNKTSLQAVDIEPSGHLKRNAIWSVNLLSRMSTSLYMSVLGKSLQLNLETTLSRYNTTGYQQAALRSTEESFNAVLDDILGIYASGQIFLTQDNKTTPVVNTFEAMRIGDTRYQAAAYVLTGIIVMIVLAEGVSQHWWQELPRFDPLAFKCITAAASMAGPAIGSELQRQHAKEGTRWQGDPSDPALGALRVMLVERAGVLQLVLGDSHACGDFQEGEELTGLTAPYM
jgi:hypothetical protein